MAFITGLTQTAWSAQIAFTNGGWIQAREIPIFVSPASSAPSDIQDGVRLEVGAALEVPAGVSVRVSAGVNTAGGTVNRAYYEAF